MNRTFVAFIIINLFITSCTEKGINPNQEVYLRPLSENEQLLSSSINQFSISSFKKLSPNNSNLFYSPFSIHAALSMTANGADGETLTGIKEALYIEQSIESMNDAYANLPSFLQNIDNMVTLNVANSIWYKDAYQIHSEFEQTVNNDYDAEIRPVDFSLSTTKDEINGWVEDKTNNKIQDMISYLPTSTVMVLINAIYYNAIWKYKFDLDLTTDRPFYLENGNQSMVKMMQAESVEIDYNQGENYQWMAIPYGNGQYVMDVLLPNDGITVNQILGNLTITSFTETIENSDSIQVKLLMPKFKIEYKEVLNEMLVNMGMGKAFGLDGDADFSQLFVEPLDLQISEVLHQAVIEVDEKGTEAAAATAVTVVYTTSIGSPFTIELNKPFAFFIRGKHSNVILFAGKMQNPVE